LQGEAIDLNARVFSVADAFDAITSNRVYRKGKPYEAAVAELETYAGCQFDPRIVAAFCSITPAEWERLRAESLLKARAPEGCTECAEAAQALPVALSSTPATLSSNINPLAAVVSFAHRTS
jgi:hypothetical protein